MKERQIIKSLKEGDREAFSMLYKQYWEKVYHFCGLYLNNRDVAEDVVQEEEITAYNLGEYIDHLIEELPERRRVIFNLSRKEHKSYKEIAFQLNISEKTVENQISEALKFLKKNIMLLIWFI